MEERKHKKKRIKEISNFKEANTVKSAENAVDSEASKEISSIDDDRKRKRKREDRSEEQMISKKDDDKEKEVAKKKEAKTLAKELNGENGDQTKKDKKRKKRKRVEEEEARRDSKKEEDCKREKEIEPKTDNLGDKSVVASNCEKGDHKHGEKSHIIVERKKKKKKKKKKHLENEQEVGEKVNDETVKENKKNKKKKGTHEAQKAKEKDMKKLPSKRVKRVTFADEVQSFPITDDEDRDNSARKREIVHSKRFSPEEDKVVKDAVFKFIDSHGLGEEGLDMVLNCKEHPALRNCWKEIGSYIPWRPYKSVYYRAHTIFKRSEKTTWSKEECDIIRSFHEKHGPDWKTLAEALGRHRTHVKDTWRNIKLENAKKGPWSQDEYKCLFESVNMDLRLRSLEEGSFNSKHGMLRDNIPWEAISKKLSTRNSAFCCTKWYNQLTSPMVSMGLWADTDDYRLLDALVSLDACSMEDVDWDNLIEHRSGDVCRKRWNQMVYQIVDQSVKSFPEQVDILSQRYCPELIDAREAWDEKLKEARQKSDD